MKLGRREALDRVKFKDLIADGLKIGRGLL
jgi:hypothetical protein